MAVPENTYTGNGSTITYSFTFPYLEETDIKVSLNKVVTTAYTFANATTIQFNTAPAAGVAIRIYRDTDIDSVAATFFAGSAIRAQDLNENFLQNNYTVQEIKDRYIDKNFGGTITGNVTIVGNTTLNGPVDINGDLDMNSNSITNVDAPSAGGDAANKTYVDTQDSLKVSKSGDTMSGTLDMGSQRIVNLQVNPAADTDAATKHYVDTKVGASGPPGYTNWSYIATGGETVVGTFGSVLEYQVGKEQVYLNGALQKRNTDYTANDGNTVTFTPALIAGDIVMVRCVNYLAADPSSSYDYSRWTYIATGGETSLSGGSPSLSYTPNREQVFLNGALLQRGTDYSAIDGAAVVIIGSPLINGDMVEVHSNNSI